MDDIIFGFTNPDLLTWFEKTMTSEFEMSLIEELTFFLGIQVNQGNDGIRIQQKKYIKEVVNKYGMKDSKPFNKPIYLNTRIDIDEKGTGMDQHLHRGIIGSLLYVAVSRPDIIYNVWMCVLGSKLHQRKLIIKL